MQVDDFHNIYVAVLICNLIECSDTFSKTSNVYDNTKEMNKL